MIKGIVCDIVDIPRIERLFNQKRFLEKVYTPYEREYISKNSVHTAAGLWAAKEAVSKALGTGFSGFSITDIEVIRNHNGRPEILLYNGAKATAEKLEIRRIHISISHEDKQAIAFAVAE